MGTLPRPLWIASGIRIASLGKEGPRLNLLSAAPHTPPVAPGSTHIRVTAALLPAKAGQPPKAAWALVVEDVAADGSHTARMKASGAIATAATHGPAHNELTTNASPPARPGKSHARWPSKKRAPQRRPAPQARSPPDPHGAQRDHRPRPRAAAQRRSPGGGRRTGASRVNIRTIERLNKLVVGRVDTNLPPEALRRAAESAAHSGDLRSRLTADLAAHGGLPWDELRVWDPDD
jgi:hypothetical protein